MRRKMRLELLLLMLMVPLVFNAFVVPRTVYAAAVGYFTLVEGQVDVLKHGQVPGAPAKLNDGVERGDVIRTKSKAKAQVKFVDDSIVTLAPDSRMAVADFDFDAVSGERRRAVLRFFKGVIHTVVSRVLQTEQPTFLMETHTAVLGVRGTENYTVLLPNATGAYLVGGLLEARSNNPQIPEPVLLHVMQFTMIPLGQPPRLPKDLTPAMLAVLQKLMDTGLTDRAYLDVGAGNGLPGGKQFPEILGFPGAPELYMQPVIPPQLPPPPPVHQQQRGTP